MIALRDGGGARIWADGTRMYFGGPAKISISGQDNLNLGAGIAHGIGKGLAGLNPAAHALVNYAMDQVGGVETDSSGYSNGKAIGEGLVVGAALFIPGPQAAGGTTKLYRAVSNAEFEQIMKTSTFQIGENALSVKWFAESAEHAAQWGQKMYGDPAAFKVIDITLPTVQAEKFARYESLDGIGPARYATLEQLINVTIGKVP